MSLNPAGIENGPGTQLISARSSAYQAGRNIIHHGRSFDGPAYLGQVAGSGDAPSRDQCTPAFRRSGTPGLARDPRVIIPRWWWIEPVGRYHLIPRLLALQEGLAARRVRALTSDVRGIPSNLRRVICAWSGCKCVHLPTPTWWRIQRVRHAACQVSPVLDGGARCVVVKSGPQRQGPASDVNEYQAYVRGSSRPHLHGSGAQPSFSQQYRCGVASSSVLQAGSRHSGRWAFGFTWL